MSDVRRTIKDEAAAASALLSNLRSLVGDDEDAVLGLVEGETNLLEAIASAVDRLAELDAHAEALSSLVKSYNDRKSRLENQSEAIRASILMAMSMAELTKLELPQATLSRKRTPPKAIVTSEVDLPARFYVEQNPKLDKKAVLDALKAGEKIPGAELSNGGESLQLRRS